ncbi:unnamed protein product [Closterium sp. Yama58-4]|nr:unnamed protein product [Closterium sp. Yama58-4]
MQVFLFVHSMEGVAPYHTSQPHNSMAFKPLLALVLLALAACACTAAEPIGRRIARVVTKMNGVRVVPRRTGDTKSRGDFALAFFRHEDTFNVRYRVVVSQRGKAAFPTLVTVNAGRYGINGAVHIEFSTAWHNITVNPQPLRGTKVYAYLLEGEWRNASGITVASGNTLEKEIRVIFKRPSAYYALVTSPSHPNGAIRGQLYFG